MKRKSMVVVIISAVCMIMAVAMVLPMGVVAADATPLTGYTWADAYYQSEWVGSEIGGASYGKWVKTDGQYNGAMMWSGEYDKVEYDAENGVIKFNETSAPYLKYHPGQAAMNGLQGGASYCSFEVYYEGGTYKKDGLDVPNFSGLTFRFNKSNSEHMYIFSIGTDGKFYVGGSIQFTNTLEVKGQMAEGWNTIEFICLPKDADGNVLDGSNGEQYYKDANGDGKYESTEGRNENWPVKSVDIYVRLTATDSMVESRAYTQEYLDHAKSGWTKIEDFKCNEQFYSVWGSAAYINPINGGKGYFSLRNAKAVKLGVGEEIYQYSYTGYPQLTQAVPVGSSNKDLTIPAAKKLDDPTADVNSWYNETLEKFVKPGATVTLESSIEFAVATGANEALGNLGSELDNVRTDLSTYTYAELQGRINAIEAAATAAALDDDHPYMLRKATIVSTLQDRMDTVAYATGEAKTYIGTITDDSATLEERADAYETLKDYLADFDSTYDDDAAAAAVKLEIFENSWLPVETDYKAYNTLKKSISSADDGPDKNDIFKQLFTHFNAVAEAFPTFMLDDDLMDAYETNADTVLEYFKEETTLDGMYTFLKDWVENWNGYNAAAYYGNASAIPEALQAAIDIYNNTVKTINAEIVEAAVFSMVFQHGAIDSEAGIAMVSDIKSKVDRLFADAQAESEE